MAREVDPLKLSSPHVFLVRMLVHHGYSAFCMSTAHALDCHLQSIFVEALEVLDYVVMHSTVERA